MSLRLADPTGPPCRAPAARAVRDRAAERVARRRRRCCAATRCPARRPAATTASASSVEPHGAGGQYVHARRPSSATGSRSAAPRGTFTLDAGRQAGRAHQRGCRRDPRAGHAARARRQRVHSRRLVAARRAQPGRARHSPRRRGRCSPALAHVHRHVCYSHPGPGDAPGRDYDAAGRLSRAGARPASACRLTPTFYLCGPPAFMTDISAGAGGSGHRTAHGCTPRSSAPRPPSRQASRASARPPHVPDGAPGHGSAGRLRAQRPQRPLEHRFGSLLELAEACDVPVRWSCRTGVCHTCETGAARRTVDYSPDPLEAPAAGNVLICCSQPSADLVLDL